MTVRKLSISFGAANALGRISHTREFTWEEFAALLTQTPPESEDKTSAGWFIPATFSPAHRDSANFKCRDALTLDYDCIKPEDVATIQAALKGYAYAIYTTASHTKEAPRLRVVVPTMRSMSADEFCAVSRKVAGWAGIELAARESHVPAQMAFLPTRRPGAEFKGKVMKGSWLDVDAVLAMYDDWTDQNQWPKRADHDSTYKSEEKPVSGPDKPGIVGDWCRAFDVPTAIEKFGLPYTRIR